MKPKFVTTLKWIAVLPAALIGCALAYLFIYYCNWFYSDINSWNMKYAVPIECSFMSGLMYMYAGIKTAPAHHKTVALILMGIVLVITGVAIFEVVLDKNYFAFTKFVTSVIGTILGYVIFKDGIQEANI